MSEDLSALVQISDALEPETIRKLVALLYIPSGICENVNEGSEFLYKLREWGKHDPYIFYQGLISIGRADLAEMAVKVEWLAIEHPTERIGCFQEEELSIKTFVSLLKTEFQRKDWFRICLLVPGLKAESQFDAKMKLLMKEGYITKDLTRLIVLMSMIKRDDIGELLREYRVVFFAFHETVFKLQFNKEVASLEKEISVLERSLKIFIELQNKKVKQMLDDDKPVNIESVYVDLTIIEEEPRPVNLEDETTYNEIAYLREIANKKIEISPVDFTKEIRDCGVTNREIWCLIGNPGCGKSFLCHRTALRFSKGELPQFSFSVSILCRNSDWHEMEKSRDKIGKVIEGEFIQKWLRLSMPVGPSWTVDLSKHLVESDGDGLLIIMDGLDEFLKEVPFQQTLFSYS